MSNVIDLEEKKEERLQANLNKIWNDSSIKTINYADLPLEPIFAGISDAVKEQLKNCVFYKENIENDDDDAFRLELIKINENSNINEIINIICKQIINKFNNSSNRIELKSLVFFPHLILPDLDPSLHCPVIFYKEEHS